jgi:hypothetical protein
MAGFYRRMPPEKQIRASPFDETLTKNVYFED